MKKPLFIKLKRDYVFKTLMIFGSSKTKNKLFSILSDILGYDISSYYLTCTDIGKSTFESVFNKMDILLYSNTDKKLINVELNANYDKKYRNKNDTYLYKIAGEYYTYINKTGNKKYKSYIKVEQININCFKCLEDEHVFHSTFTFYDETNKLVDTSIKKHNIYIVKNKNICYDDEKLKDYQLFVCESYEEMEKLIGNDEGRKGIMEDLKKLGSDIKFINLMNHEEDTRIIERQIGEESGIKKRIEIGKIQGIEMGSRKMIKSMHNSKLSIKKICEITKMTEKEIMSILNIKSN